MQMSLKLNENSDIVIPITVILRPCKLEILQIICFIEFLFSVI